MSTEQRTNFDVVVIGAGGAGCTAAHELIQRGASVALVERWKVGGTCLNVGCDPTKALVRSAEVAHLAKSGQRFGVDTDGVEIDWPAVIARVDRVIDTIRGGDGEQNIRDSGVSLFKGHARFRSTHEVDVDGQVIHAEKVIIASGAANTVPPIDGLAAAGFITNFEAVGLPTLPASLVVIGGGVVGVEFAQIFARFGVEVTIVALRSHLLPKEESDLTTVLQDVLAREGIIVLTEARVTKVACDSTQKVVTVERGYGTFDLSTDEILVAVGRKPVVDGLDLVSAGVVFTERGIVVNPELRTSNPSIWAIGDVTGIETFTHVADYQARIAACNVVGEEPPQQADYRVIPHAVFTDPELGRVGLTEKEAQSAGYDVKCAIVELKDIARAITAGETEGLVKLVSDRASGHILGGHVVAARGGELLPEIALAMCHGLTVRAIAGTVHAYPTMSEAVFWAAFELAKPDEMALDALRGVSAPMGNVPLEV